MIVNNPLTPSLMKKLAIPLSNQNTVAKWLVIPRKRESSKNNNSRSVQNYYIVPLHGNFLINWIPAFAGMTTFRDHKQFWRVFIQYCINNSFRFGLAIALLLLASLPAQAVERTIPTFAEVKAAYVPSEAWLLDRNGEVLAEKRIDFSGRRLSWLGLAELSPATQQILIASEDQNFYEHAGIDWQAVIASAWMNLLNLGENKHPRGASTLTMQLAGLINPALKIKGTRRTFTQKWNQAIAATEIEKVWSKPQILEAYLNLAPFRGEIIGIHGISQALFNKEPSALNHPESLLLIALLRGTMSTPQVVAKRACSIPGALQHGTSCDELLKLAISRLSSSRYTINQINIAPHIAQQLLSKPGTRVVTTLDAKLQRIALRSLREHLSALQDQAVEDGAIIVIDNASGEVLAYVGSNLDTSDAVYVDGVRALRQAGSTLKPLLYGMAIEDRLLTAASVLDDSPIQLTTPSGLYIPQNYDRDFKGLVTVRTALAASLNVPAVRTLGLTGIDRFVQKLRLSGLDSVNRDGEFYGYSLALGGTEVRLIQLTNAYRALANGGMWSAFKFTKTGGTNESHRMLSAQAAYIISDILSDSGARAITFGLDNPLVTRTWTAVKTGTSKDMRDNWCIGYSGRYSVGVWVGNFNGEPMRDVSGISGAAPVWRDIMDYLHSNQPQMKRHIPPDLIEQTVHFVPEIEAARTEWFISGTETSEIRLATNEDRNLLPKIHYPHEGMIVALDPDIPPSRQRLQFNAHVAENSLWFLDDVAAGNGSSVWWTPTSGHHQLRLTDPDGNELDRINFEVRGE